MAQKAFSPETRGRAWPDHPAISREATSTRTRTRYIVSWSARLTPREFEVLQLVAAGYANAEIASRLMITSATIISYLNSIYGKLGVRSRTGAMRYAIDHHLCLGSPVKVASSVESAATHTCSAFNAGGHVGLTRREMEVLLHVTAGLSNAEIADRLVITLATVFGYLNDIYRKLGVNSRTAAMRYAIDHHLC
ncbi:MAG TPA: LuxR C-terminal-related transcriptional regulator [Ktedonobacteraceae bacterium]|nr:LuxR C-terminal-related transcriptional regulator [Ktedonobacteraceae bacterium]